MRALRIVLVCVLAAGVGAAAWASSPYWLPAARGLLSPPAPSGGHDHDHGAEAGHDHGHDHSHPDSLVLSPQARANIGLTEAMIRPVGLGEFTRVLPVPAMVVERPGRTKVKVVAPMSGIVTDVYAIDGETVSPGKTLFKIRFIHEDLVQAQTEYLATLGKLDVEDREIQRLRQVTQSGAVAERVVLEREYEKHKLEALLRAQHEALLLHGLSAEQVGQIRDQRRLLSEFLVYAPTLPRSAADGPAEGAGAAEGAGPPAAAAERPLVVQQLTVHKGDFVQAGATLCVLVDFDRLYVEGQAFEQDAPELVRAHENGWEVTAVPEVKGPSGGPIPGLKIVYLENRVDPDSRALHFYVGLPNEVAHEADRPGGHHFLTWRYKPGQRMQLRVPVEKWRDRIVLPVDAVAHEGAEAYVFVQNGNRLDRRPVHVEYRDQLYAVLENDGSVFPGERVAMTGAHQLQVALKNKSGGGADPHAGHNH